MEPTGASGCDSWWAVTGSCAPLATPSARRGDHCRCVRVPTRARSRGLDAPQRQQHRQVLSAIFKYARRADTYALAVNPVTDTDTRREDAKPRWTTTKCTRSKLSRARAREVSSASVGRSSTPTRSTACSSSAADSPPARIRRRRERRHRFVPLSAPGSQRSPAWPHAMASPARAITCSPTAPAAGSSRHRLLLAACCHRVGCGDEIPV
jgi:hypothetical protein